ncbi:hypothetical protein [Polyangium aurulentum]|uniref:hypothetical protein n=1 Tax=Polyangium aurulentum TaxID=2567896 RepID=UPI0010AE3FB1|nr:hypothetical protein [Polyangium aurulentum]UQA62214.1 RICIN domain-containing protein [Polyangium aurulentum]
MASMRAELFIVHLATALSLICCDEAAPTEAAVEAHVERMCTKNGARLSCMTSNVITRAVELEDEVPGEERQSMRVEGDAQSGYLLADASGENCLTVHSFEEDAEVSMSTCVRGENLPGASQRWVFEAVAQQNGAYRIKSASSPEFCIAARPHPLQELAIVALARCGAEDPTQIWMRV